MKPFNKWKLITFFLAIIILAILTNYPLLKQSLSSLAIEESGIVAAQSAQTSGPSGCGCTSMTVKTGGNTDPNLKFPIDKTCPTANGDQTALGPGGANGPPTEARYCLEVHATLNNPSGEPTGGAECRSEQRVRSTLIKKYKNPQDPKNPIIQRFCLGYADANAMGSEGPMGVFSDRHNPPQPTYIPVDQNNNPIGPTHTSGGITFPILFCENSKKYAADGYIGDEPGNTGSATITTGGITTTYTYVLYEKKPNIIHWADDPGMSVTPDPNLISQEKRDQFLAKVEGVTSCACTFNARLLIEYDKGNATRKAEVTDIHC